MNRLNKTESAFFVSWCVPCFQRIFIQNLFHTVSNMFINHPAWVKGFCWFILYSCYLFSLFLLPFFLYSCNIFSLFLLSFFSILATFFFSIFCYLFFSIHATFFSSLATFFFSILATFFSLFLLPFFLYSCYIFSLFLLPFFLYSCYIFLFHATSEATSSLLDFFCGNDLKTLYV